MYILRTFLVVSCLLFRTVTQCDSGSACNQSRDGDSSSETIGVVAKVVGKAGDIREKCEGLNFASDWTIGYGTHYVIVRNVSVHI